MISLKTEIIYFKCTTDFEFEFNLNAAVQMRLFTECPAEEKSFLSALSLAVSRSRAIIITSKFDETLITKLAGAIGFKTETVDPNEYGITEMETDKLITGGVPLVTDDGIYAGIILESGPQSLIIITDEKKTRKKLMSGLVHTYLNDVANSANGNTPPVVTENPVTAEAVGDSAATDEIIEEKSEIIDGKNTVTTELTDTVTETATEDAAEGDGTVPLFFGLEEDVTDNDAEFIPKQKRSTGIFTVILAIILFLLIGFIVYSLIIEPFLNNISMEENFKHIFGFLFE